MTATDPRYAHLTDPAERQWLTNLDPQDVLANAHRIYDFMTEQGIPQDSYTREMAFEKAAEATGIDYNTIYDAWMFATPLTKVG